MRSTTRSPRTRCRHHGAAFIAVNNDWEALCRTGAARRALRRWRTSEHGHEFATTARLDAVVAVLSACKNAAESDAVLAPLLLFAAAGDEVAARTVMQAMLPMAITVYRSRLGGHDEQWNVISVLAEQIASYPLVEHPTRIAGHLRNMTRRALWRQNRRLRLPECPLEVTDARGSDSDCSVSLVDVLAADSDARSDFDQLTVTITDVVSTGGLDADRASLLLAVAAGHRVVDLATAAGCHPSVMSRRISAATAATIEALDRAGCGISHRARRPIEISAPLVRDSVTTAA